jgi:hypothetical protein
VRFGVAKNRSLCPTEERGKDALATFGSAKSLNVRRGNGERKTSHGRKGLGPSGGLVRGGERNDDTALSSSMSSESEVDSASPRLGETLRRTRRCRRRRQQPGAQRSRAQPGGKQRPPRQRGAGRGSRRSIGSDGPGEAAASGERPAGGALRTGAEAGGEGGAVGAAGAGARALLWHRRRAAGTVGRATHRPGRSLATVAATGCHRASSPAVGGLAAKITVAGRDRDVNLRGSDPPRLGARG